MYHYQVRLKFCAAHQIEGHPGKCAKLHGHNWEVQVHVHGSKLNELGYAIDFSDIKKIVEPVVEELDHTFLNEWPYFKENPPTAENVARYIYDSVKQKFSQKGVSLQAISIWETDGYCVRYEPIK